MSKMNRRIYVLDIGRFEKLEIFQGISESTICKIIKSSEIKKYKNHEILFYDKEIVNNIYIIVEGSVSLYKINANGQKKVIFILNEGRVINDVIIQDLPASINCEIFEKAEILSIDKRIFIKIMQEDFELCKKIIESLALKTRRMYRQLKNTPTSIKLEKRLAAKLYKLGRDYGVECKGGVMIKMDITITYLADLLGSQRESVSRAFKILQNKNLIEMNNKRIFVPDLQQLSIFFKTS